MAVKALADAIDDWVLARCLKVVKSKHQRVTASNLARALDEIPQLLLSVDGVKLLPSVKEERGKERSAMKRQKGKKKY
jgi:hypothetical protein